MKPFVNTLIALVGFAVLTGASPANAQDGKNPLPRPPAKTKTQPALTVKVAAQTPGDNGKIGMTYTLGKGSDAFNVTLLSAEYTTRVMLQDGVIVAPENEKLLVLHYTAHNPGSGESSFNWSSLKFTAVDAENVSRVAMGIAARKDTTENCDVRLKPAEQVEVFTVFKVPAKAVIRRIVVQRGEQQPVLRLDLGNNEIKGLPAPVSDPADPTGAIARSEVPGLKDTFYPLGLYDVKVLEAGYVTGKLGSMDPDEEGKFFVVNVQVKNASLQKRALNWAMLDSKLKTLEGEILPSERLIMARRSESVSGYLEPGAEFKARFYYKIPKDTEVTKFVIWEGAEGRRFLFDMKDMQ
jgi:hypothetical protein